MAHIELDQYDEAATLLDSVISVNPGNARGLFQQTRIFIKRGQLDLAGKKILRRCRWPISFFAGTRK